MKSYVVQSFLFKLSLLIICELATEFFPAASPVRQVLLQSLFVVSLSAPTPRWGGGQKRYSHVIKDSQNQQFTFVPKCFLRLLFSIVYIVSVSLVLYDQWSVGKNQNTTNKQTNLSLPDGTFLTMILALLLESPSRRIIHNEQIFCLVQRLFFCWRVVFGMRKSTYILYGVFLISLRISSFMASGLPCLKVM